MRRPVWFTLLVLLGVAADLFSKAAVFHYLPPGAVLSIIPGVLQITQAKNTGVAFSLLAGHPVLIFTVRAAFIVVILWIYAKSWRLAERLQILALGLLLVGALGNLVDQALLRYVRDFIDFVPRLPLIGHWAVFNLADMCIVLSVGLFLAHELFLKKQR
jgi:signal peptidase II